MTWVYLDDHFPEHPKAAEAGPLGRDLFVAGLAYTKRQGTNGFIPAAMLPSLVSFEGLAVQAEGALMETWEPVTARQVATRLVDVGLLEVAEGGWRIHDYLEWNRTAEEERKLQEERRAGRSTKARSQPRDGRGRFQNPRSEPQPPQSHRPRTPYPIPATDVRTSDNDIRKEPLRAIARERDEVWDAMETCYGKAPATRAYRGGWQAARKELAEQAATAAQLVERVHALRGTEHAWMVATPNALAKHWGLPLPTGPPRMATPVDRAIYRALEGVRNGSHGGDDALGGGTLWSLPRTADR
jgi:hypothetical protein